MRSLILLFLFSPMAFAADYEVYFLGGQSNMEGYGHNSELPDSLAAPFDDVWIFAGNDAEDDDPAGGLGIWSPLGPGFGLLFASDGRTNSLGDRFGPELTFAARLQEKKPDSRIAIIKYARGGSSLARDISGDFGDWDPDYPGLNQYTHGLATIRNAWAVIDIDGDGEPDRLVPKCIIWMQGESDAYNDLESALAYEANLSRLMDLLRAALREPDLAIVIGKITDSGRDEDGLLMDHIAVVQEAQESFAENDRCAEFVTVADGFEYPPDDPWHYTTAGYLEMGTAFADAVLELEEGCVAD